VAGAPNLSEVEGWVLDVAGAMAGLYERVGAEPPWLGYLARGEDGALVGLGGFKGPPREGAVEIAYFTFPPYEGRGVAGAMAAALVAIARAAPEAPQVIAHTLPEINASARLLTRLGFAQDGEVVDPDDGPVWRWVLAPDR
jgi:RimJ/RimL family protein N-acetyltransferase